MAHADDDSLVICAFLLCCVFVTWIAYPVFWVANKYVRATHRN